MYIRTNIYKQMWKLNWIDGQHFRKYPVNYRELFVDYINIEEMPGTYIWGSLYGGM